ncbi:MAG: hypothetical protein AB4042_16120 [Leptolyngbyaceae cyanobacterium]
MPEFADRDLRTTETLDLLFTHLDQLDQDPKGLRQPTGGSQEPTVAATPFSFSADPIALLDTFFQELDQVSESLAD